MNSSSRDQLIAAKDQLHQLTQVGGEEEHRQEGVQHEATRRYLANKAKLQAEKEMAQVREKEKEEARYLRQHNKTVSKVLNQVAQAHREGRVEGRADSDDEEEEDEDGESDSDDSQEITQTGKERQEPNRGSGLVAEREGGETEAGHRVITSKGEWDPRQ